MEKDGGDLANYEGKYPDDLFNKTVVANGQAVGRVAKETGAQIVVFSDSGGLRFDVPKSKVALSGGSVVVDGSLEPYAVARDAPVPEGKSLRPSAEEIRQKAGKVTEEPSLPVGEDRPSMAEERIRDVAGEFTDVGRELEHASRVAGQKMKDLGVVVASDMEVAARQAASETKELAQTGATATKEKIAAAQSSTQAGLSADNVLKIEKESRRPTTELDLAAYEGRYPSRLFNKTVVMNGRPVGRVAKETDDVIVVFSDTDSSVRFDVPKSEVALSGGSVVASEDLLFRYRERRNAPMPPDRALRPAAGEMRMMAAEQPEVEEKRHTTPDAVMEEGGYLTTVPRPETTAVSRPEGYVDAEPEISKKIKSALTELKEGIVAGTKVAEKKVRKAQAKSAEKQANADAETISKMGDLAMVFAGSFEDVLSEIRTRTYADQEHIYTGFLKLMDQQRDLVVARRDLAARLKDSVEVPVVGPRARRLGAPPELPGNINESRMLTERKSTTTTRKRKRARRKS